jgi:tripeptide aminopeptidase
MNKSKLIEILSIQSESYNQWRIFAYIIRQCKRLNVDYYVNNGNIYITKGIEDNYPCIVAHMDTVHDIAEDLTVIEINGNLTGFNAYTMEQTGIGGDDKVGIFIALQCLELFDNIKVAFFRDEETGCEGSYNADFDFFNDCNFILQCDRKGNGDFVTNAGGIELSSKQFQADILPVLFSFGYKYANGMMTDVMALKECSVNCSMANISCGYYNPHCSNEFVNLQDVENCLLMVQSIVHQFGGTSYPHSYTPYFDNKTKFTRAARQFDLYEETHTSKWDRDFIEPYCADCWREAPEANGLCKNCNEYYKKEIYTHGNNKFHP